MEQQNERELIQELLARAYKYDDKPHRLYSFIRHLAELYPDETTPEIVRLMDQAYNRSSTDYHAEAEALFLRLDRIYAAVDAIAEIERTFKTLVGRTPISVQTEERKILEGLVRACDERDSDGGDIHEIVSGVVYRVALAGARELLSKPNTDDD